MPKPNMVLLYVNEPKRSVKFYEELLDAQPMEQSPTFAMFKMNDSTVLGLWSRSGVEPKPASAAGATEIGVHLADEASVLATHADWQARGIEIAQAPVRMDFGLTFVGLDPDGHRLRIFCD